MAGVLIGFAIIGAVIAAGYLVGRLGILGPHAEFVLGRFAFFVLSPALLFTVLAEADARQLFSALLPVSAIAALSCMAVFAIVARFVWRRAVPETTIGSLASGYANANNIGLPIAAYVLGDPAFAAPIILLQLVILTPIALTILDVTTSGTLSIGRVLSQPIRNPLIIGSALGLVLSVTGVVLPEPVMEPFHLIGAAAVPTVLLLFGMSLHGRRILEPGSGRRDILLAVGLKIVAMPVIAWVIGAFVVGLTGLPLFAVVVLAALPTAQNVFNYAVRFERAVPVARDAVLITTVLSVPALVVIAALLAPR
ncbi:AEC family transporter [Microcella sp.]|uniref:AEC family transporter n=1 Tax=Microcella sp. TaxID=1913979 RepID=UPI003F6FA71F